MKILVLGGTGAMGTHLVQLLAQENNDVFVTTRSNRNSEGKIHYIQGNAHFLPFLKANLEKDWDVIIDFMVYNTDEFSDRVNFLLKSTKQYIFLSSSRVYASSDYPIIEKSNRLLDYIEDDKYLETDEYGLSKARQENILISSSTNNWTIIRPYITYSEKRLQLGVLEKEEWLYRALKGRTIVFSNEINEKYTTLTYGLDVSKGIKSIVGKSKAYGEILHITSTKSIKWKDVLDLYLDVLNSYLGYEPKVIFTILDNFIKCHPAEYQIRYDRLYNRKFNNNKISNFIEVENFIAPENGLRYCLESFLKNQDFSDINIKLEARKDRISKERTSFKEIPKTKAKIKYLIYRYFKK